MILRLTLPFILYSCILSSLALSAKVSTSFNCNNITVSNAKFDLTPLAGEHVINKTRSTDPTSTIDSLRFNLCDDLVIQPDVPEADQCPSGTRACFTQVNRKSGEADRVITVIPVAVTSKLDTFSADFAQPSLSLTFYGADYPSADPKSQTLNLSLICDQKENLEPIILNYDGTRLAVEWTASAGCPLKDDNDNEGDKDDGDKTEDPEKEHVGTGVGWFFLLLLLAFATYFGLGAYYNYSTYGATGYDLIPHRDFWKEVPYMFRDVFSHLCSNMRPRRTSSRGGYISV